MKIKPYRSRDYLKWVSQQPCIKDKYQNEDVVAHHLMRAEPGIMGGKVSDAWVVPIRSVHHNALHKCGDEKRYFKEQVMMEYEEVKAYALRLFEEYHKRRIHQ